MTIVNDIVANAGFTYKAKKGEDAPKESYPWDKCVSDRQADGYSPESAEKICGTIRARAQGFMKTGSGKKAKEMLGVPGGTPILSEPGDFVIPVGFDLVQAIKEAEAEELSEEERRMIDAETKTYKGNGQEEYCPACGGKVSDHDLSEEKETGMIAPTAQMGGGPNGVFSTLGMAGAITCPSCGHMSKMNVKNCPFCGVTIEKKAVKLCKTPKFKRCIEHVTNPDPRPDGSRPLGKPEGAAYGICYTTLGPQVETKKAYPIYPERLLNQSTWADTLKAVGVFVDGPNQTALSNMPPMRLAITPELQQKVRHVFDIVHKPLNDQIPGTVIEVLPDAAIVSFGNDDMWRYPFIINEKDEVIFDRPVRVRAAYVPYEGGAAVPPMMSQVAEKEEVIEEKHGKHDQRIHSAKFAGKGAPDDTTDGTPPKVDRRSNSPLSAFIKGAVIRGRPTEE